MMIKQSILALLVLGFSTQGYSQDPNAQKFANEINVKNKVYRSVEIILWPELNREATK